MHTCTNAHSLTHSHTHTHTHTNTQTTTLPIHLQIQLQHTVYRQSLSYVYTSKTSPLPIKTCNKTSGTVLAAIPTTNAHKSQLIFCNVCPDHCQWPLAKITICLCSHHCLSSTRSSQQRAWRSALTPALHLTRFQSDHHAVLCWLIEPPRFEPDFSISSLIPAFKSMYGADASLINERVPPLLVLKASSGIH